MMNTDKYTARIDKIPFNVPVLSRITSFHHMDMDAGNNVMGVWWIAITSRVTDYLSNVAQWNLTYSKKILYVDIAALLMRDISPFALIALNPYRSLHCTTIGVQCNLFLVNKQHLIEHTLGWTQHAGRSLRAKLIQAEARGFSSQSAVEILKDIKKGLGRDAL